MNINIQCHPFKASTFNMRMPEIGRESSFFINLNFYVKEHHLTSERNDKKKILIIKAE